VDLTARLDSEFPEMGVLEIENTLLCGRDGFIITKEGFLLSDHSWFGCHTNEIETLPRLLPKGKKIKGTVLSLASDFAVRGYGHFAIDSLARLKLFYEAGYRLTDVDYIFCPKPTPGNAEVLFKELGIPAEKCIWADDNKGLRPETLIACSFPGTRRNYQNWVTKFLQREILPNTSNPTRKLYITRKGYKRDIENEQAVYDIFKKYDFEIYDPIEHKNSHIDFAEAAVVVGISGSALTGLAFCKAGTKVLEILSTDHVYPYYYTLADAADLQYNCLVCQSSLERQVNAWGPSLSNIHIDELELDLALSKIIGCSP
jgi:capsular polysaccharide biosynthesis protein